MDNSIRVKFRYFSRYSGMTYQPGATEYVPMSYADRLVKNGLAEIAVEPWEVETAVEPEPIEVAVEPEPIKKKKKKR